MMNARPSLETLSLIIPVYNEEAAFTPTEAVQLWRETVSKQPASF